jgi:hypothetical protein
MTYQPYRQSSFTAKKVTIFLSHDESNIKWVPCHHGMARPQVADGGDSLQIWRVAANVLNKQPQTADRGWSSSLWVWRGANNPP